MWQQIQQALYESTAQVLTHGAALLPGLAAFLVALIFAVLVGLVVGSLLRRALAGVHFDSRINEWGFSSIADWSPSRSPSRLVARLAFWFIVFLGFLIGATALDAELMRQVVVRVLVYLPNVVVAGVVLVVGSFVARFLARSALISAVNMRVQSARLISLGVKWLVWIVAGAMALEHLGIGGEIVRLSFAILFGGIVLALALAVGLGSKEMVSRSLEKHQKEEDAEEPLHHL